MKKTIQFTLTVQNEDNINLTYNSSDSGSVELTSYSSKMNFDQFCEFADTINELREKWAIENSKNATENGN